MNTTTQRTDELIKKDVVDHLIWSTRLDASDISVTVKDGEVTLNGEVPSYIAKLTAANTAMSIYGVAAVDNELKVVYPTALPAIDDEGIKTHIMNVLHWNPYLQAYKIDVEVENGHVTLSGTVKAFWEKNLAEDKIAQISGVTDITNLLAVVPEGDLVDEAIAEDVVKAIDRSSLVSIENVNVKVDEGDVILTGMVQDSQAKETAYEAALYTYGVTNVDNNLVINSA